MDRPITVTILTVGILLMTGILSSTRIHPQQKRSIVSIVYKDSDERCSGSIIHESVILTLGLCIDGISITKVGVKFYDGRKIPVRHVSRTFDGKMALLFINGLEHLKGKIDVLPLVKLPDQKLKGRATLLGWHKDDLENARSLNSASFKLTEVDKSLCSEGMNVIQLEEEDVCVSLPDSRINLSEFYPDGAPIIQDGIQIGIVSALDIKNSLMVYRRIPKYRDQIDLLKRIRLGKTNNYKRSRGYRSLQF
ncbi:hypothetical protein QAD02_010005 [Eretmocerus hayati]|uniref:Uncharacterized protein n=1 Tax=Eretmocerus hayati TaxID=131215 RepID=A0ACC2NAY0_9HYME|nr:hypothetical protein QAD02_010005 [Eretmocerus hayati]